MWRWRVVVALLLVLPAGHAETTTPDACHDLPACIQQLRSQALARHQDRYAGMGPDEERVVQRIVALPGGVDALVPLLEDPDEEVAELAAYALRDVPVINSVYLPQIRRGLDRGLGWLAPALARIGTAEAAKEAVDRYMASDSSPGNQEAYALHLLGRRTFPFLLEYARCLRACKDTTYDLLRFVLAELGPERAEIGPPLLAIALDRTATPQVARGALWMIAALGEDGLGLEHDLLRERDQARHMAAWIDTALVGIHSAAAGEIFARHLAEAPEAMTLVDLAQVGRAGRDAGPTVLSIFREREDLRLEAAATLGYIGYSEAIPNLVSALDDVVDPRMPMVAAAALAQLQATSALAALDRTAAAHWYPPARDAARKAAESIRSGVEPPTPKRGNLYAFVPFYPPPTSLPDCEQFREQAVPEPPEAKLYTASAAAQLQRLAYPSEIVSYGAADEAEQRAQGKDIVDVRSDNLLVHRQPIRQTPDVALRVEGGWLAGSNRGEWGGELVFISDKGDVQRVADENVEDVYHLGTRIVATIGLAHLSRNEGAILEIKADTDGYWQSAVWRRLPGAPRMSYRVAPDSLLVQTAGLGAIVINANGDMRMASCAVP